MLVNFLFAQLTSNQRKFVEKISCIVIDEDGPNGPTPPQDSDSLVGYSDSPIRQKIEDRYL